MNEDYNVTNIEREQIIATFFASTNPLKLKEMPSKFKSKLVVIEEISKLFTKDKMYKEKEINEIIKGVYPDFPLIRRYLVDLGFLQRAKDCSAYWV